MLSIKQSREFSWNNKYSKKFDTKKNYKLYPYVHFAFKHAVLCHCEEHFLETSFLPVLFLLFYLHRSFHSSCSYIMLLAVAFMEAGTAEQFSGPLVSLRWALVAPSSPWSVPPLCIPLIGLLGLQASCPSLSPFFLTVAIQQTQSWLLFFIKFCLDRHDSWMPCCFLKTVEHMAGTQCVLLVGWLTEWINEWIQFSQKTTPILLDL